MACDSFEDAVEVGRVKAHSNGFASKVASDSRRVSIGSDFKRMWLANNLLAKGRDTKPMPSETFVRTSGGSKLL